MRAALLLAAALAARPASAGLLSASGVFIKDSAGSSRAQFSNNERITFTVRLNNAVASANRVQFVFKVTNPAGSQVFTHTGNSVPGSVGNSASQVSGIPVSSFFTGPGVYTFTGDATLDGQTVSQSLTFAVSSPNIILIYPPNGARDVADRPLILRWSASGAAKYRVTVGDNPALYNAVFAETTAGPESFLSYPDNPPDTRARLAAGQVYYWKVEGLDQAGNAIAQSDLPFNFTAQTAVLTRDLAVTGLDTTGRQGDAISFLVRVANQGGTTESNIPLRFSVGGLPAPGSPVVLPQMRPGDIKEYPFTASLPGDQGQSLAIGCVEFFDDNVPNNCKTVQVTRPTGSASDTGFGSRPLSKAELWQAILERLRSLGMDLSDYDAAEMSQQLSAEDMQALLDQLSRGQVQIGLSGPAPGAPPPPAYIPPPVSAAPPSSAPPPTAAPAETVRPDDMWAALADKLLGLGLPLDEYKLVSASPSLSPEDLEALLAQLAEGTAQTSVSGPPPNAGPLPTVIPPPVSAVPPAASAGPQSQLPPANAVGREFGGVAASDFGPEGLKTVAKDEKSFARLWARLSRTEPPELDFKQVMAVVLVAGTGAEAERIEVEDVMETPDGLRVRYKTVARTTGFRMPGTAKRKGVPFMVKVVRASGLAADFEEVRGE